MENEKKDYKALYDGLVSELNRIAGQHDRLLGIANNSESVQLVYRVFVYEVQDLLSCLNSDPDGMENNT